MQKEGIDRYREQAGKRTKNLPLGETCRLAPLPPVIAARLTRFCMLKGLTPSVGRKKYVHVNVIGNDRLVRNSNEPKTKTMYK